MRISPLSFALLLLGLAVCGIGALQLFPEDASILPLASAQMTAPKQSFDTADSIRCDDINATTMLREADTSKEPNPYLEMAWNAETLTYDYPIIATEFLATQDELFAERLDELTGTDVRCELSQSDVPSAFADKRIEPLTGFLSERLFELRQADCALFHVKNSEYRLCSWYEGESLEAATACEDQIREKIETMRGNLRVAMQLSIMQLDEMTLAWSTHKRLECLNESLIDYREIMLKFLEMFANFPAAFINAAQST